jgi:hypothetical protein
MTTQPPPTLKAIVTDAMRRLEKACRLSESRYENEIPLTANVPDALLIDVRAVLNAVNPEASEIMREALAVLDALFNFSSPSLSMSDNRGIEFAVMSAAFRKAKEALGTFKGLAVIPCPHGIENGRCDECYGEGLLAALSEKTP